MAGRRFGVVRHIGLFTRKTSAGAWFIPLRGICRRTSAGIQERPWSERRRHDRTRSISSTVVVFHHAPGCECDQNTEVGSGVQRACPKRETFIPKKVIRMMIRAIFLVPFLACGLYAADGADKTDQTEGEQTQVHQTRRPHIRFGGIMIGAGYTHWSGGWCCGYPAYGYYGAWMPFFPAFFAWDPFFYSPYYGSGFTGGPNMGEVKLHADSKDAAVFLDGPYAGTAAERKSIWR